MCSLTWKNLVTVIAVFTLQISNSNGDKSECTFERIEKNPGENNCCFYEPECYSTTTCQPIMKPVWKPINETIWNCRNFTRKIKECVVLEEEEKTCKFFKQEICKPIHLPGKCAKVTHKKNCTTKCPPKHPLYDPEVHKECSYKNGTTISIISEIFETATEPINLRTNKLDLRQEDPRIGRNGRNQQSGSNPNQILIQSEQKDIRGSKSNETSNFDKENDNAGDDNCCQSFSLNLANEIKTKHSTREGSYILGSSIINGFKTWISSDGKTAIWYIKENLWCIGDVDNMSTSLCSIHSNVDALCPAEIKGEQWSFFIDGDFQNVGSSSDLTLICQKARSGREEGGHFIPRPDHIPAPLGLSDFPALSHAEGHEHEDPLESTIQEGCHESCEYETVEKCCDFPDQQCDEVWLEECIIRPKINCTWTEHETCFFFEEDIIKHEKIDCEMDGDHCIAKKHCEDVWWCKVCKGDDNECYKTKNDYHLAHD